MIDEVAYLIGGAAVGFLLNAAFGPRRAAKADVDERDQLIADIKAKVADASSRSSGDGCAPQAIWKIKTVTKPARPNRLGLVTPGDIEIEVQRWATYGRAAMDKASELARDYPRPSYKALRSSGQSWLNEDDQAKVLAAAAAERGTPPSGGSVGVPARKPRAPRKATKPGAKVKAEG